MSQRPSLSIPTGRMRPWELPPARRGFVVGASSGSGPFFTMSMNVIRYFVAVVAVVAVVALAALVPSQAAAQITLTHADALAQLTASGTTTTYDVQDAASLATLQVLADLSGGGQTWDISTLPWANESTVSFSPVAPPVPGSTILTGATHITRVTQADSTGYVFASLSASALDALGVMAEVDDGAGGTMIGGIRFAPFNRVFPLPLTTTSSWGSAYEAETVPAFEGIMIENDETASVEGWGTLVTPAGSAQILKVRRHTVSTTTITIPGLPPIVTVNSFAVIEFVSTVGVGATIDLDESGQTTGASYSATEGTGTSVSGGPRSDQVSLSLVGANPVRQGDGAEVEFRLLQPSESRLDVWDALGRHVSTQAYGARAEGSHRVTLPTHALAPGTYTVRLQAGAESGSLHFVVVR